MLIICIFLKYTDSSISFRVRSPGRRKYSRWKSEQQRRQKWWREWRSNYSKRIEEESIDRVVSNQKEEQLSDWCYTNYCWQPPRWHRRCWFDWLKDIWKDKEWNEESWIVAGERFYQNKTPTLKYLERKLLNRQRRHIYDRWRWWFRSSHTKVQRIGK